MKSIMKINLNKERLLFSLDDDIGILGMSITKIEDEKFVKLWNVTTEGFEVVKHEILVLKICHEN